LRLRSFGVEQRQRAEKGGHVDLGTVHQGEQVLEQLRIVVPPFAQAELGGIGGTEFAGVGFVVAFETGEQVVRRRGSSAASASARRSRFQRAIAGWRAKQ
jgi:hypothetical protein